MESARVGNEEKLASLLTPLNVNCHASDGRKVIKNALEYLKRQIVIKVFTMIFSLQNYVTKNNNDYWTEN